MHIISVEYMHVLQISTFKTSYVLKIHDILVATG